jgi:hypothetical protein
MKRILWALLFAISPSLVQADGVRFEARVAREQITLADTLDLTISIDRDGSQSFEGYRAPSLTDFDILHTSTSEQMQWQMLGSRQSVRAVEDHLYVLRPKKQGVLVIGPAQIKIAGQELRTRSLSIRVTAAPKGAAATPAAQAPQAMPSLPMLGAPPSNLRGDEELYLDAQIDRPKVYVGQQVTATWRLYTQGELLKFRNLSEPKHEDFWSEDLFTPTGHLAWDRQTVRGREYAVATLSKKALFPLKAGRLALSPLEAEATTMQTMFYSNASAVRKSNALSVEVLPLPAAGRPAGFESSNVGAFEVSSVVDRAQVKAGEAVTWTLTVKGVGNVHSVKLSRPEHLEDWKVYEPAVKENIERIDEVKGEKSYHYLLMPQKAGTLAAKYAVARAEPISITVEGDFAKLGGAPTQAVQENMLVRQIRPIRNRAEVRTQLSERLWRSPRRAAGLLLTPPLLYGGVLLGDAIRRRLSKETAGGRRRRARRTARRRLRVAEQHVKAQRPGAFFGECARVLYEHLEYRLGQKVEALTLEELRMHLLGRGFQQETAEAVVKELENCDFARFAPSASGPGEMRAALRRVSTLLGWIERVKTGEREVA